MPLIAEVAVSGTAYSFDMLFSYKIPEKLSIKEGCRVLVPFGKGNSRRIGMVMKVTENDSVSLKSVIAQIDNTPVLSAELLYLVEYLHEFTFCTYFDAVKVMLPPAMNVHTKEHFRLSKSFQNISELSEESAELLENLQSLENDSILTEFVENYISANGRRFVDELLDADALKSSNDFKQVVGDASMKMVRLSSEYIDDSSKFSLTPKQKKAVEFLEEYGSSPIREIAYMCGFTESIIKRLVSNGVAEEYEKEIFRKVGTMPEEHIDINSTILSEEQQAAHDKIFANVVENKPSVFLLHGITGSGKTAVFEKLIHNTINIGRKVIMLVPEISLTPQMLGRFRSLFGEKVAVIHSGLSLGQRFDEYKRIKRGEADIVIGTRSAIFAPLENIGLIILDEEGERTYKSESSPRYLAHDVSKRRCAYNKSVLLLASATPSVESYYLAERNMYNLVEMKNRYGSANLPEVSVVDMTDERYEGNNSQFSRKLVDEINYNLQHGEQSIILLNRRGFDTIVRCGSCQKVVYCPNCSVPLTFHKKNKKMMCHYCGFAMDFPKRCSTCGSDKIVSMGFGTQKLEEEIQLYFPTARVLRMDADNIFSRDTYEENFTAFKNGEYDIMIGTQMIGKGLDFPNVTLVGVLSIDSALYAGDFRSYERTFSLITQVVGRGGRGELKGRAILQTFIPDHYVMELASEQNYQSFYKEEIAMRRTLLYPPVCDMFILCFAGEDEKNVQNGAKIVIDLMNHRLKESEPKTPVRVLGPVRASYGKLNGKYRWRIIIKSKNNAEMRNFVSGIVKESLKLKDMKKITLYVDVNGDIGV